MAEDEFSGGAASVAGLATTEQVTSPAVDSTWPNGAGPVLTSPNGSRYRLAVADDGTLSTTDASIIVYDSFTRANETPVTVAETGQAYTTFSGIGLSVISNTLGSATSGTKGSVVGAGVADAAVSYRCVVGGTSGVDMLLLRVTDANNYLALLLSSGDLRQVVAGAPSTLGTLSGDEPLAGEVVAVRLSGADVTATRDGVSVLTTTTTLLTGTNFGFQFGNTTGRVDDFTVRSL